MKGITLLYAAICVVLCEDARVQPFHRGDGNAPQEIAELRAKMPVCGVPQRALVHTMRNYRASKAQAFAQGNRTRQLMIMPEKSFPVLAAKFADSGPDDWPINRMQQQLFDGPWPTGTMKDYFHDMSYGQFTLSGSVHGWYRVASAKSYYSTQGPRFGNPHTKEFYREVLQQADAQIDFRAYDNDGPDGLANSGDDDGFVDAVFFISAGRQDSENIWPHFYTYSLEFGSAFVTGDLGANGLPLRVDEYLMANARAGFSDEMASIGLFCHEFGHVLGLPDLYDVNGGSPGIGAWGLMGLYALGNNGEKRPLGMEAWSKAHLG